MKVVDTKIGKIGALICGENTNPLARYSMIADGEQIHVSSYPPIWPTHSPNANDRYDLASAIRIRAGAHSFEGKVFNIVASSIIDEKTRNEKIKNFFIDNRKIILSIAVVCVLIIIGFYSFQIYKDKKRILLSDRYNDVVIRYENKKDLNVVELMKDIIYEKDSTYSPLALYFLIDNDLIKNLNEVNDLFNLLINKTKLEEEIRNLIIYKKALFNADTIQENELLEILKPIINSQSVWKSHALYLIAEYFYSKNERQKSKEFFSQILDLENANQNLRIQSQKRLNRDLSD